MPSEVSDDEIHLPSPLTSPAAIAIGVLKLKVPYSWTR